MTAYPTLGHDPAPGDPWAVRQVAAALGAVAGDAESITSRLQRLGDGARDAVWRGPAADAFHRLLADVGPDVVRLAGAHREGQDALVHYAGELERAQDIARRAESDAAGATRERDRATQTRRQAAGEAAEHDRLVWECDRQIRASQAQRVLWVADPAYQAELLRYEQQTRSVQYRAETAAGQARGREQAARSAETTATAHLQAAQVLGEQARELRDRAAGRVVGRLDAAGRRGQADRGLVERLLTAADDVTRSVVTSRTFQRLLGIVDDVSTVLGVLALGALAVSPFLGPAAPVGVAVAGFLGTAATIAGVVTLLGKAAGHRYGTHSGAEVAWAAAGIVPAIGKGIRPAARLVTRALPRARPLVQAAARHAGSAARTVGGSRPVREVVRWADDARTRIRPLQNFTAGKLYDLGYTVTDLAKKAAPHLLAPDRPVLVPFPAPGPAAQCPAVVR